MAQSTTVSLAVCHALLKALKTHLVDGTSQEELLGLCLNAGGLIVGSDRAVGYWFDKDGELDPIVRSGLPMVETKMAARRMADQVVASETAIWVPDLAQKRWIVPGPGQQPRGMLGVPLRLGSGEEARIIGVMCFERDPGVIDPEVLKFLEWLGEMVVTSIRHGLQERQQRLQFDQLLDQVNRLGTMLQMDLVAQRDAVTDPDSGLVNRAFLEHHCPIVVAMAHRYRFPVAGLMVQYSRADGQTVAGEARRTMTQEVARQILRCARSCDTVAQLGDGTLFALVPHTGLGGATVLANRITSLVGALIWPDRGGPVAVAVGVTQLRPDQDGQGLLVAAEAALQLELALLRRTR
ncbi:MAG: diguanylate cyclase [Candidatus Sericytochromatia bacterium]|nr:diguanylate cyclase [Candidatus Sericytochromatia bacterium]